MSEDLYIAENLCYKNLFYYRSLSYKMSHITHGKTTNKFIHWNVSGINSEIKKDQINFFLIDTKPFIMSLSETWIKNSKSMIDFEHDLNKKYKIFTDPKILTMKTLAKELQFSCIGV